MLIAFIGCGEIAVTMAKGLELASNARMGMAMDPNADVARDLGETYGVPWTARIEEVLANKDVAAVYIATPHYLHAPLTIQAAQAGKHVMVEKPIATRVKDAQAMIEACRRNHVALSVCFVARYEPQILKAKALVESGTIGEVVQVRIGAVTDKPEHYWTGGFSRRVPTDWRLSREKSGGGVLIMNCIHYFDAIRYITGLEYLRASAEYGTLATKVEVEDVIAVALRLSNGAVGVVEGASCARGKQPPTGAGSDVIRGTAGQIVLRRPLLLYTVKTGAWQELGLEQECNTRTRYIEEFVNSVRSHQKPPITGEDGLAALAIVQAAYESQKLGRPVTVEELVSEQWKPM